MSAPAQICAETKPAITRGSALQAVRRSCAVSAPLRWVSSPERPSTGGALQQSEQSDANTAIMVNRDFDMGSSGRMGAAMMTRCACARLYTCRAHRARAAQSATSRSYNRCAQRDAGRAGCRCQDWQSILDSPPPMRLSSDLVRTAESFRPRAALGDLSGAHALVFELAAASSTLERAWWYAVRTQVGACLPGMVALPAEADLEPFVAEEPGARRVAALAAADLARAAFLRFDRRGLERGDACFRVSS